jgi:hypothetical protein
MTLLKAARAAPAIAGSDPRINERLDGGSSSISITFRNHAEASKRLWLQFLAAKLDALGPAPLAHFLSNIEAGANLRSNLEEHSRLPADFIKANRGDQFVPALHAIDGGRS